MTYQLPGGRITAEDDARVAAARAKLKQVPSRSRRSDTDDQDQKPGGFHPRFRRKAVES